MLGAVLILGDDKKGRQKKAWELLSAHGFKIDTLSPDLLVVQKESEKKSVGIAQAREIKDFLREKPFEKKVKAVLVEDAQLFTDDAQGSLLKILEEPPAFGLIILLCDKEGSLLPTVVSRCQKITLPTSNPASGRPDGREFGHSESSVGGELTDQKVVSPVDTKLAYDLRSFNSEQLFDLAKDLSAKGKEEAIDFLEQVLRDDIKNGAPLPVVQKLEKALKELKDANVALKFALEYLFLLHADLC